MLNIPRHDIRYEDYFALNGFEANFLPQTMTAVIGLNGVGKTSLMKYLMQYLIINFKDYNFNNIYRCRVAYAPQNADFHPYLYWPDILKMTDFDEFEAQKYLKFFKLKKASVQKLSAGQQQILNILLAFAQRANILVLDEPSNHLDWQHQKGLIKALQTKKMCQAHGLTKIFVITHHLAMVNAENGFDRVLYLKKDIEDDENSKLQYQFLNIPDFELLKQGF